MSMGKFKASPDANCPKTKRPIVPNKRRRISIWQTSSMSGKDNKATTQA